MPERSGCRGMWGRRLGGLSWLKFGSRDREIILFENAEHGVVLVPGSVPSEEIH